MKAKNIKKKNLWSYWFYRIYFPLVALAVIAIIVGGFTINSLLKDYESAQPGYVANDALELFINEDYTAIRALDTTFSEEFGGNESFYTETVREYMSGKSITLEEAFSGKEDEKLYRVLTDGERFATFTLVPSGETTAHGNRLWKLGFITTNLTVKEETEAVPEETVIQQGYQCKITVPAEATVTCDGVLLSDSMITASDVPFIEPSLLPSDADIPMMKEYSCNSETETPIWEVTTADGTKLTPSLQEDGSWYCSVPEDVEFRTKYEENFVNFAKKMAKFTTADFAKSKMRALTIANSPADKILKGFDNTWATKHSGVLYENIVTFECHHYGSKYFSCKVSFDYVLKTSVGRKVYPTVYTMYFQTVGKSAKLYNIELK